MKRIIGFFLVFIGLLLIILALSISIGKKAYDEIKESDNELRMLVGKEVVVNEDTLLITDFSLPNSTLILENGIVIHKDLYDKISLKEDQTSEF